MKIHKIRAALLVVPLLASAVFGFPGFAAASESGAALPGRNPAPQHADAPRRNDSVSVNGLSEENNMTWLYSLVPSKVVTASKENQYSIYNGEDQYGNLCKNSVKYDFTPNSSDYDESSDAYDDDYATYQIDYSLNGQYKTFSTVLTGNWNGYDVINVEILGDGNTLYKTGITFETKPLALNLDVTSVKTLSLRFSTLYNSCAPSNEVIFSGAQLIGKAGTSLPSSPVKTVSYEEAGRAFKLDTASYTMAPGNIYDFKVTLKGDLTQQDVKVSDSRTGSVVKLTRIPNTDKYRITAVKEGTSYVVVQVGNAHLSFQVNVTKGARQGGAATHSNYAVV
ncbi:exported protein of unknown function [Ruminococcaceae bacterium BL-6]|nr:exported protein of unknown function [Ruminococcaceae bacterium BL-6]